MTTRVPGRPSGVIAGCALAIFGAIGCADAVEEGRPQTAPSTAANADTTSPDAVFLRALANHQAGLMFLAHVADQHHDTVSVRGEALAIDEHHHRQTDSAMATLRALTGKDFLPTVNDRYQSLVAELQALPAREFDARFWTEIADHHREGITLIDSSLARLRDPRVIALANLVRAEHAEELTALDSARAGPGRPKRVR